MIEAVFGNLYLFILRFSCFVLVVMFFDLMYLAGKFAYEYYTCDIPADVKKMLDDLGRIEEKVLSDAEKIESTEENWDNRVLGADERYVKVSGTEEVTL